MQSRSKRHIAIIAVVATLTVFRILLAALTPVTVDLGPSTAVDDALFVRLALSIYEGNWLGAYDSAILSKNPGYALVLAFCGYAGVRYQVVLVALQALAAMTFAVAMKPLVTRDWIRALIYLAILFCPMLFTTAWFRRIYRDALTIPVATLALAGYIGLYLRRERGPRVLVPWAIVTGMSVAALQVIKENGLWIVPLAAVCSLIVAFSWVLQARRGLVNVGGLLLRGILLVVPVACALGLTSGLRTINRAEYGVAVLSERFDGSFADVCSRLSRIEDGSSPAALWVSRNSLKQALDVSPTLSALDDELELSWNEWSQLFDGEEVYGDLAYWALRDALVMSGGYDSAVESDEFWDKVEQELDNAFEQGRLEEREGLTISSVAPPISFDEMPRWIVRTVRTCSSLATYSTMDSRLMTASEGDVQDVLSYEGTDADIRELLGGNAVIGENPNDGVAVHAAANTVSTVLGHLGVLVCRACLLFMLPALLLLAFGKVNLPGGVMASLLLIVAGLLLSALACEAATCWYVCYQLAAFSVDSYLLEIYKYSPEFFVLLSLAGYVVLGTFLEACTHRRKGYETGEIIRSTT